MAMGDKRHLMCAVLCPPEPFQQGHPKPGVLQNWECLNIIQCLRLQWNGLHVFFTKIASTSPNTHANSAPVSQLQLVHFVHGYSRTTSVCSVFVCLYQVVTG